MNKPTLIGAAVLAGSLLSPAAVASPRQTSDTARQTLLRFLQAAENAPTPNEVARALAGRPKSEQARLIRTESQGLPAWQRGRGGFLLAYLDLDYLRGVRQLLQPLSPRPPAVQIEGLPGLLTTLFEKRHDPQVARFLYRMKADGAVAEDLQQRRVALLTKRTNEVLLALREDVAAQAGAATAIAEEGILAAGVFETLPVVSALAVAARSSEPGAPLAGRLIQKARRELGRR